MRDHARMTDTDLAITPLTADRFGDLAALFEEGGDPKWCWCTYFRVRGMRFSGTASDDHRAAMRTLSDGRGPDDTALGLLAYRDGRPVGWVSLGPREDFERLTHSRLLAAVDDRPVWSIVCFVVSRNARGQGIAIRLLDAAIEYAHDRGATTLEAYPIDTGGLHVPPGPVYKGTLAMFERAGFRVVATRRLNASSPERPIVQLEVAGRASGRAPG